MLHQGAENILGLSFPAGRPGRTLIHQLLPSQPSSSEGLQRAPGSVLTRKEEAAPNCKTEILITKRNKSAKKCLLLKPWDKTKIRLVSHLLIITSSLCKDFWLVILNELLEDSHILTSHRQGDKNDCNIKVAQF